MEPENKKGHELFGYCKRVSMAPDTGGTVYLLEGLRLPEGCSPQEVDALLCPFPRDSYPSRLYFSQKVSCPFERNWNFNGMVAGKNWVAHSWKVEPAELTLTKILLGHLEGFTRC